VALVQEVLLDAAQARAQALHLMVALRVWLLLYDHAGLAHELQLHGHLLVA